MKQLLLFLLFSLFIVPVHAQIMLEGQHFPAPGGFRNCSDFGDINGDGFNDIIIGDLASVGLQIWLNNGDNTFTFDNTIWDDPANEVYLIDMNGDTFLDILVGGNTGSILWYNDGSGNFPTNTGFSILNVSSLSVGDYNEDGLLDVFLTTHDIGNEDALYFARGDGTFEVESLPWSTGIRSFSSDTADINQDGHLDLIIGLDANVVSLRENQIWFGDGEGGFFPSPQSFPNEGSGEIQAADYDNDGDLDIVSYDGEIRGFRNDGSNIYDAYDVIYSEPFITDFDLLDMDVDGDLDLVIGRFENTGDETYSVILFNDGNGNFTEGVESFSRGATADIGYGDIDGDNDIDLFTANNNNQDSVLWINQTDPPFQVEEQSAQLLKMYPNPVRSELNIENPSHQNIASIKVVTISGQLVHVPHKKSTDRISKLEVHALPPGVYIGTVSFENGATSVFRFVKN